MADYERKIWTFRGDSQLDPILKKWSDQSEKSFHLRQALRGYLKPTQRSDSSMLSHFDKLMSKVGDIV